MTAPATAALKLDLGCGPNKRAGFTGVDSISFVGVDLVHDLTTAWPWEAASVEEVHASHFLEHLDQAQRMFFANELYRVLIPGGKAMLVVPHWNSGRAYGDPTHKWPAVCEFSWLYWNREWRQRNALHTDAKYLPGGFDCDFDFTTGGSFREDLLVRSQEFQQFAIANYKEALQDTICTVTKRTV